MPEKLVPKNVLEVNYILTLNIVNIKMINKHDKSLKIVQNKHFYVFIEKRLNSNAIIVYIWI